MPDGRMVSRSIAWNEALGAVSFEADYLFERMIPFLDSAGRLNASPKAVKAQCCPLRDQMTPEIIARCLAELDEAKLIVWYKVEDEMVAEFPAFAKHQRGARFEREAPSRFPPSSGPGAVSVRTNSALGPKKVRTRSRPDPEKVREREVKGSEVKGSEDSGASEKPDAPAGVKTDYEPEFEACWKLYPKRSHDSKRDAWRAWRSRRNAGVPNEALLAGVERYARYCTARGIVGSEVVKRASTFFGPGEHWADTYDVSVAVAGPGVDPHAMGLWQRYKALRLLTMKPREEYHQIGAKLVTEGLYATVDEFLDELRVTQPWTLNNVGADDRKGAQGIASRLAAAKQQQQPQPGRKAS